MARKLQKERKNDITQTRHQRLVMSVYVLSSFTKKHYAQAFCCKERVIGTQRKIDTGQVITKSMITNTPKES